MLATLASLVLLATNSQTPPVRQPVQVTVLDRDLLLVRCTDAIDELRFDGLVEKYDYFVEWSEDRRLARILLCTNRGPLKLSVDTRLVANGSLRARHTVSLANPASRRGYNVASR